MALQREVHGETILKAVFNLVFVRVWTQAGDRAQWLREFAVLKKTWIQFSEPTW